MSISLVPIDHDFVFKSLKKPPIIVNDFKRDTQEARQLIINKTMTRYNNDVMDSIPRCDCGAIYGADKKDTFCEDCLSYVTFQLEDKIESILWARVPNGVRAFINPVVWIILSKFFSVKSFDLLQWLCNTNYQSKSKKEPSELELLRQMGVQRGYNNFIDNFFPILDKLFSLPKFKKKEGKETVQKFLNKYHDRIFCEYLPLPNRVLLVIENTNFDRYAEPVIFSAVDAIDTITSIDCSFIEQKLWVKENKTAKTLAGQAAFIETFLKDHIAKKTGLFRKNIYAARSHYSFRAVISSLTREHAYDEIHIPWTIAIGAFRTFLQNKLERKGYNCNQITEIINKYSTTYNEEIARIFQELIDESPEKGIPVSFCRNPTLGLGSIQKVRITKVKDNLNDPTISMSILIVRSFNA